MDEQKSFIKQQLIQLEREIQKSEIFWKDFPLKVASLTQLKEKLGTLGANANLIDVEFVPGDKSIQE